MFASLLAAASTTLVVVLVGIIFGIRNRFQSLHAERVRLISMVRSTYSSDPQESLESDYELREYLHSLRK